MKPLLLLFFFFFFVTSQAQNITVNSQIYTPQELVENILINSGCIENVLVTNSVSGNFDGIEKSFGYFDANGSNFPFENGLVMSTGKLSHVPGPNNSLSDDDAPNWNGDSDLEQVLGTGGSVNATVIEFEFTPNADKIRFRYIFASEEYQEGDDSTCEYSDVFAFLIKPIGGQYMNIAVVPNTDIPVKVTTVHPEIPGGCEAENEVYFGSFNGNSAPINFNGQTIAMNAESDVVPGQTYHIKLVIADDQNYRYDSAVFLEGSSFNIGADLGNDLIGENALCEGETHLLQVAETNQQPLGYVWYKNELLIPNENTDSYLVDSPGTYKVEVDFGNGCIAIDEVLVQYADFNGIHTQVLTICDENADDFSNFDLTEIESDILQSGSSFEIEGYFLDENATEPIEIPTDFQNTLPNQTVFVKVSGLGNCVLMVPIELVVTQAPIIDPDSVEQFFCTNSDTEFFTIQSGLIGDENDYTFQWTTSKTTPTIEVSEPGTYSVEITKTVIVNGNPYSCSVTNNIQVLFSEKAEVSIVILGEIGNNSIEITATGVGNYSYALDGGNFQSGNIFPVSGGSHIILVKDLNGCGTVAKEFSIVDFPGFFTPNNDGINDYWHILGIDKNNMLIEKVHVFDRYGKLLTTMGPYGRWNGTYNGKLLPSNEYWFRIDFKNNPSFMGHFSLVR